MTTRLDDIRRRVTAALTAAATLLTAACTADLDPEYAPEHGTATTPAPESAAPQMVLVKFSAEAADIIEQTVAATRSGETTRSGMVTVDDVLDAVEGVSLERVFAVDNANEERTRKAGLHRWYVVRFGSEMSVGDAVKRFAALGEVQTALPNRIVQHAYKGRTAKPLTAETVNSLTRIGTRSGEGYRYNDPMLQYQWHLINRGDMFADTGKSKAGADVQCEKAWEMSTGDPSIIVAVLDEGICLEHEDLKYSLWTNEREIYGSTKDNDGNGFAGDRHGYDFVQNTGVISWDGLYDTGHATHVAGIIAAQNDNLTGISSIAGGTAARPGVKLMSCQIFSNGSTSMLELVRATKYATDNGAVVLQCSFGYNSGAANVYDWGAQGFRSEEEWSDPIYGSPLEKDAFDYFNHNAGSPNGPIDGGIAIFAAGNESAPMAGFPGAAADHVSVAATAADFTPAIYSNYGEFVNIAAPGGDQDYYYEYGGEENERKTDFNGDGKYDNYGEIGCILSTLPRNISSSGYGYMEGSSMACPHVSGVVALGLSYAMQLRKHFTAEEFRALLYKTASPLDEYYNFTKRYYRYVADVGPNQMMQMVLSNWRGKMGAGQVNAYELLRAIGSDENGMPIRFPNVYVPFGKSVTLVPGNYFAGGDVLTYTVTVADTSVATAAVDGNKLTVDGVKEGTTDATVKTSNGTEQHFVITVRKGASDKGWL